MEDGKVYLLPLLLEEPIEGEGVTIECNAGLVNQVQGTLCLLQLAHPSLLLRSHFCFLSLHLLQDTGCLFLAFKGCCVVITSQEVLSDEDVSLMWRSLCQTGDGFSDFELVLSGQADHLRGTLALWTSCPVEQIFHTGRNIDDRRVYKAVQYVESCSLSST